MAEKNEVNVIPVVDRSTDEKPASGVSGQPPVNLAGRAVNHRPSASALLGHHHHHHHHHHQQQNQLHQNRNNGGGGGGGGMIVTDYRGEPVTASPAIVLDSVGVIGSGGGRRPAVNGTVPGPGSICGAVGGPHAPHMAVWHPRPLYPFPLPMPNTTSLWHSSQPPFPAANAAFAPFMESEWSRHCRLPIFNPELPMEPVDLQHNNGHHRHRESSRALDAVQERLERAAAHSRPPAPPPPPVNLLVQDDREPNRHHA